MVAIIWGNVGERYYDAGVDRGVFYPKTGAGVAWNGLVSVNENVSGGSQKPIYLEGRKVLDRIENEDTQIEIETLSVPDGFLVSCGLKILVPGLFVTNQPRSSFGFCYRTLKGNDVKQNDYSYKLHLIYGVTVSPSSRSYESLSASVNLNPVKWTLDAVPPSSTTFKPSAHFVVDVSLVASAKRTALENQLYGTSSITPNLPTQATVISLLT